jgi:Tfp pilus assembly protein PilF
MAGMFLLLACLAVPLLAQEKTGDGPANEKAQKSYKEAFGYLNHRATELALDSFKKADKQDGGRCLACQKQMIKYGVQLREWKVAETAAGEMVEEAQGGKAVAIAHFELGVVLLQEGMERGKDEFFSRAHEEMGKALAAAPNFPGAIFADGQILARLKQDDGAKARFAEFVKMRPEDEAGRRPGPATRPPLHQPTRTGPGPHGPSFCGNHHRRTAHFDG